MPELSSQAQEKVAQLKQAYIASLPEKATALEEIWRKLKADPHDEKHIIQFVTFCHKLAGSTGSYGLDEIFKIASRLEQASKAALGASVSNRENLILKIQTPDYRDLIELLQEYRKS